MNIEERHYFRLKGASAEKALFDLAHRSFMVDWCFPNPKLPDGKELCDLFVLYNETAIIWQVKDVKLDKNGQHKESDYRKNIRQLHGAHKRLVDVNRKISLTNVKRKIDAVDTQKISEVFLIACFLGDDPAILPLHEKNERTGHLAHVFNRGFTEIVLSELDTIQDFVLYLRSKEALLNTSKSIIINGGEEELLAHYIKGNRSFNSFMEASSLMIEDGAWRAYVESTPYKNKEMENYYSYAWDEMIGRVHEGSSNYEDMARHLARHTRFERRSLAKVMGEAWFAANSMKSSQGDHARRIFYFEGITYVFLFMNESLGRQARQNTLELLCFVALGMRVQIEPNIREVVGIASESKMTDTCSYDFYYRREEQWTNDLDEQFHSMQKKYNLFLDPIWGVHSETEFPK